VTHKHSISKAVKELDKEILFWGNIPDTLEKHKIYDKKSIKEVLDELEIQNNKIRGFVYDQMKLREEAK
jgi:hypothetical protein